MSIPSLLATLDRSVAGDPWHGASLRTMLADVSQEEATAGPIPGGHSIAQIVVHVAAWMDQAAAWLEGHPRNMTDALNWPEPPRWPQPIASMLAASQHLRRAIDSLDESRLVEMVGTERDAAAGTGLSIEATVVGVAEHNAYHGGQIAMLKRAWRSQAKGGRDSIRRLQK